MGAVREWIQRGKAGREALEFYLQRIEKLNGKLNVYVGREGKNIDKTLKMSASGGRLAGVPVAVKDNLCVKGWEVTCASKILKGYTAPYSATVIEKLLGEGALLLGRTNMDEFAFGSSCETSCYGPTHNPWNALRAPGGSSGGSAAAVAAGLAAAAIGSDTGGSIRQPASFCGVVGLKPTYGRVSRYGLVAFASSLDQVGPFGADVEDAALLLEVIAGFDPKDSTCADLPVPEYSKSLGESVRGLKVGLPRELLGSELAPDVKKSMERAADILAKEGAEVKEVSLPHAEYAVAIYYVVAPCEASSNLARFDGVKYGRRDSEAQSLGGMYTLTRGRGFGAEAKRRILLGTYALSSGYYDAYYVKAMKARRKMIEDFARAFEDVDVLMTPTSPGGAFKLGERTADPLEMYLSDIFTISANLTGVPAISVPCGLDFNEMPLGLQFMAKPFNEEMLFRFASVYEQKAGFKGLKPKA